MVSGVVFVVFFTLVALVMVSGCNGGLMGDDATAEAETNGIEETAAKEPQEPRGNIPGNINQGGFVAASDGWVYFTIPDSDEIRLFKMRSDGTEKQVLVEDDAETRSGIQYINVIGDWIYCTFGSDIVKMRTDGSELTVIDPIAGAMYLNVVGDWIYYFAVINIIDGSGIYKVRVDGEEKTKIYDDRAFDINVFGDWIYFSNWDDDRRPYKVSLDGSESGRLSGIDIFDLQYYDGMLYSTDALTISRVSVDGGMSSELDHDHMISDFIIYDGWIYYLYPTGRNRPYNLLQMDPKSGETEIIQEIEMFDESERGTIISNINIADGWVYIYAKSLDDDYETVEEAIFRIRTDGSNLEKVISPETEIESAAHKEEELNGVNDYLVDVPALIGLDFEDALAVLDQHFSDPPTVEGPKEYMGAEITMYAYVDIIEDSLVALSIGLGKIEGLEGVDYPPMHVAMGTIEGIPMDYDLKDLYRFTNIDPNAAGYSLEDIEVTDNLIEFTVHPKS